ncbi:MAG: hypothetical protein JWQ21_2090 [Herminiimonas sp.]|nr:hypothetical protein [Herminiimonas sp.]
MSSFVISLDFEMLWGMTDLPDAMAYRRHVEGEWDAVPRMLSLFRRHGIHATWATVGMVMCADHAEWRSLRPDLLPGYSHIRSSYEMDAVARDNPKLFFGRPLVERILATPGQELATHTYSHFYCGEAGATPEQFAADLRCAHEVAAGLGVRCRSMAFPRNQVIKEFVAVAGNAGIRVYRGNPDHWLYRTGHSVPGGLAGRGARFADSWVTLSGSRTAYPEEDGMLVNIPASLFMRPWSRRLAALESLRLNRLKRSMTSAARAGDICHLWWHPHNFGVDTDRNLAMLESVIKHFLVLQDRYGMQSARLEDFAPASRESYSWVQQ